jgi:hypothetical protein
MRRPDARSLRLVVVLLFFTAAPTAGDIGSACQPEDDLDPARFFALRKAIDCERCGACGLTTTPCSRACASGASVKDFPRGCAPVEHDGEVCLDALLVASCTDYAAFMSDEGQLIPTECDFCPGDEAPPAADAGGE